MEKRISKNSDAVSPVVGVMLMIVVTVLIAAVLSIYAGGMAITTQNAPSGSFNCKISNGGTWENSAFELDVISVSESIPTKDVKLTVSWIASDGTKDNVDTKGPAEEGKENCQYDGHKYNVPLGYGPDIDYIHSELYNVSQFYGNYALAAGRTLYAMPIGASGEGYGVTQRYEYSVDSQDPMRAILGRDWNHLRVGDRVNVRLTYIPTGKVLFDKDVVVEDKV